MDENYILELLRMPQTVMAKMVWGLQKRNKELETELFYAQLCSDTEREIQEALIRHLSAEIDKQYAKKQNETITGNSERHTVRFSLGGFSVSLSVPRIREKSNNLP